MGLFCFNFVGGWLTWSIVRAEMRSKDNYCLTLAVRVGFLFFAVVLLAGVSNALTLNEPFDFLSSLISGCLCFEAVRFWLSGRASARAKSR